MRGGSKPQIPGGQAPTPATEPQEQHQQDPSTQGRGEGRRAREGRGDSGHLLAKGVPGRRLHGSHLLLVGTILAVRRVGATEVPAPFGSRGGGERIGGTGMEGDGTGRGQSGRGW
jgi:hypothetical protein